ncbi:transposase [Alteromonadaceae bacterium 2753L.S.0a.02]|nr:transposase [Alteromonadaceae bacterium 2753L.S.0a.02]TVZ38015.1 transposase [Alteromonadaceae bacterium 2753L.S.0a.02]TVZ38036.1 transposase [Alteromonadaceae bacterium 2753L.S.0a.02]TVZ38675.1 transposase [Alteromonadaceae bacterium 2753L.S.0a.02]TVZ40045.1 transposase [Alteromonadaceae bacterium 2753L.S.0a.02]
MQAFVGIDVSKDKLDCLWLRDPELLKVKTKVLKNTPSGIESLAHWLVKTTQQPAENIIVVMEATGIYHENLAYRLYEQDFSVVVANPAQIKSYAKSLGSTHKTDKCDSLVIARYGKSHNPMLWKPEPPEIRELKALIARLEAIEKDYQREYNRREKAEITTVSEIVMSSIEQTMEYLKQEKARLESQIDDHIDRHPHLKKDRELLQTIPAVGSTLSRLMLCVIRSRRFKTAAQLAAYLGLIPKLVESGVFKGRSSLTKSGPASVRAKLYMAAVCAGQHNPDIARQKKRLLANGKNKMQALGAAMRKLVQICFGVLKNQKEYMPQVC